MAGLQPDCKPNWYVSAHTFRVTVAGLLGTYYCRYWFLGAAAALRILRATEFSMFLWYKYTIYIMCCVLIFWSCCSLANSPGNWAEYDFMMWEYYIYMASTSPESREGCQFWEVHTRYSGGVLQRVLGRSRKLCHGRGTNRARRCHGVLIERGGVLIYMMDFLWFSCVRIIWEYYIELFL
jgi:hypothetical protein